MQDLLNDFLMNNPLMDKYIMEFLNSSPAFRQKKAHCNQLDRKLTEHLDRRGQELFLEYEDAANDIHSLYCTGYYLFGLKLRRELRDALWQEFL